MPYDPIKDFTPIARIGSFPSFVAVNPDAAGQVDGELVAYAKANPGKLSYGVGNTTGHIAGETLKKRTGIDIVRVTYRSNPTVVTDLIAGHIPMVIPDFNTGLPQLKAQKVRALAVLTKERNRVAAGGPDTERNGDAGLRDPCVGRDVRTGEPAAGDREGARRCRAEGAVDPVVIERLNAGGTEVFWSGPQEFAEFVKAELVKWTAAIKEAGIEPE